MKALRSVLVANRGEIARRVFRTARDMGLRTVAVFVDADVDAPFVTDADEAVRLPASYLDGDAVIEAALRTEADAVHPGYGFLSENAEFAQAVTDAGLTWVGPGAEVIGRMGDKLKAKEAAEEAEVPTLPSSEDLSAGDAIGFPLLVKAVAGGGGRGMRVVESAGDLDEAIAAAQREAAGAFGDDRVFLERYVPRSRHIEIQILGDAHGELIHLGERECSIQRRHQKIIEEAPSPYVTDDLREAMGNAALRLGRAMRYRSAGTVEFLVDDPSGEFWFLEVNTRLQVEHPVTEAVIGIDLVREQLRVAAGEPLGVSQEDVTVTGHAVEARLYAEDPAAGFLPAAGVVAAFRPASEPVVRWDSGVEAGSVIGVDFDPMLAKVIAHGPTRDEAAGRLARALECLHIGGVTTNRDFLVAVLRHDEFGAGATTTDFIDRHRESLLSAPTAPMVDAGSTAPAGSSTAEGGSRAHPSEVELTTAAIAAAMWLQEANRAEARVLNDAPSGWRNARLPRQSVVFTVGEREATVAYAARRDGAFDLSVDAGDDQVVRVHRGSAGRPDRESTAPDERDSRPRPRASSVDLEIDGRRRAVQVTRAGDQFHVQSPRGTITVELVPRFSVPSADTPSGGLTAPMPGAVLDVRVTVGESVEVGQVMVVLEAMKMEHHLKAPVAGTVTEVSVAAGSQVENGAVLMVIDSSVGAALEGGGRG